MSPEQASGERDVDGRSDVYSLGAVLYEMLTGDPPFAGRSYQAVVAQVVGAEPPWVRVVRKTVPEHADVAVHRALAKSPADRFASAAEFSESLGAAAVAAARPPRSATRIKAAGMVWLAAVVGVLALWWGSRNPPPPSLPAQSTSRAAVRSVAVLPLVNISGDTAQEYFVQGIHEALITELSQISALDVISRTSVMRFRDSAASVPEIAAALGVDAIMEGSVQRVGNVVRINVALVQASPERNLWAQSYEDEIADVLAVQRRVTADVAREIELTLTPDQQARLAASRPVDPEAYDLYLRARFAWNLRTEDGFHRAVIAFDSAITIDPTYADAYAGLSDAHTLLTVYGYVSAGEGLPLARRAAERAVALDTALAAGHAALAEVHFTQREWDAAERQYLRAIALNPGYASAHHFYGWFLSYLGRHEEAIAELRRAWTLDPLSGLIATDLGAAIFMARRYDDALGLLDSALALDPGMQRALWVRTHIDLTQGNTARAIVTSEELAGWWGGSLDLAYSLAVAGSATAARALIEGQIADQGGVEGWGLYRAEYLATVYTALGDYDQALAVLELAAESGIANGPISLLVWPGFDPLRGDPRFEALLQQIGFPEIVEAVER